MGNVTLPTPVFLAGGALCLMAGYLVGSVLAGDPAPRTSATVVSFDQDTAQLCLSGDKVAEQEGVDSEGRLCGTLRGSATTPKEGDSFLFRSVRTTGEADGGDEKRVVIYGDVVD